MTVIIPLTPIINNVKLVLENEVVHGSLEVQDGEIRAFAESQSCQPEAMDGEGGWLLPGLIELHTDNLDKFFTPRPKVDWPAHSAMSSHDALMVASGITTVLDAVAIGDVRDGGDRLENLEKMINAIEETQKRGVNRADHVNLGTACFKGFTRTNKKLEEDSDFSIPPSTFLILMGIAY